MSTGAVLRAALLVVAAVAGAWLAHGLRAVDLREQGQAIVADAGPSPDQEAVLRAAERFRRAAENNPDPRPQLDEAALLLSLGLDRAAASLLEGVVAANPGSIRGWGLLATAVSAFDEQRSIRANGELLKLYGRLQGQQLAVGVVRSPSGRRFQVRPGKARGSWDSVRVSGGRARFSGWAGLPSREAPAQEVLVVAHGRVVASVAPDVRRDDVARSAGVGLRRSGFRFSVSLDDLRDGDGDLDAHLFAAGPDGASPLLLNCARPQDIGC